jgi:HAD superfamily hydrolase (TIGR01490 family)
VSENEPRVIAGDGARGAGASADSSRAAAFFDLDRTLMAGSSGIFFARAAFETGMITRARLARDVYENLRFRLRGSNDDWADAVRRRVGEMIAGVPVRELARLSPQVLAGVLPRLYPQMLERAYEHQDAGRLVYIVTAASQEMADLLAHVLAFDGGLGSRSEVLDGRYTGRAAGPFNYREGKVVAMRELAERERIDLSESFAYSDSESDLPMLRVVGHPVVVNPDTDLAQIALAEGWEVVRLDRLGRRLKLLVAAGTVGALGALGRIVIERGGAHGAPRRAHGDPRPLQSRASCRRSGARTTRRGVRRP